MDNIFQLPPNLPPEEFFEVLVSGDRLQIERIISSGHTTPMGEWYDQETDEWVMLLQGEARLVYADGTILHLKAGDYLLIRAHQRHRVDDTSHQPPCIWLAIHFPPQ